MGQMRQELQQLTCDVQTLLGRAAEEGGAASGAAAEQMHRELQRLSSDVQRLASSVAKEHAERCRSEAEHGRQIQDASKVSLAAMENLERQFEEYRGSSA